MQLEILSIFQNPVNLKKKKKILVPFFATHTTFFYLLILKNVLSLFFFYPFLGEYILTKVWFLFPPPTFLVEFSSPFFLLFSFFFPFFPFSFLSFFLPFFPPFPFKLWVSSLSWLLPPRPLRGEGGGQK